MSNNDFDPGVLDGFSLRLIFPAAGTNTPTWAHTLARPEGRVPIWPIEMAPATRAKTKKHPGPLSGDIAWVCCCLIRLRFVNRNRIAESITPYGYVKLFRGPKTGILKKIATD